MRIGQGFDVHPLVAGRKLIIGGVEIPYHKGLEGHSDADVLLHAICGFRAMPLPSHHVIPITRICITQNFRINRCATSERMC